MPPKKKQTKARGKKTRRSLQQGEGVKDVAKKAFNFAKKHKIVSRGLAMIPHPVAQAASRGAAMVGLGKAQHGDGIFSDIGRGLGGLAHGIGSGIGGIAGGLFGGSAPKQKYIQVPVMAL